MSSVQEQHHHPSHQRPWWKRARVRWMAVAVIIAIVAVFSAWWVFFRSYVSTNDARVATNILRVAPVGVGGIIEKVAVEEGDFVKAGQVLVEIDHRVPAAQYNRVKAKYQLAKIELGRVKNLVSSRSLSARDFDNARTNYDIAEAELELADLNLQNTYLKSPIDGIVIQKLALPGNILEPGQVAVIISDVEHVWVSANIEETKIALIKPGQPVFISIDEGGSLTGRVQEINVATSSQFSLLPTENASGNYTKIVQKIPIKIELDPHPNRILRAGQSVTVKIQVK